MIIKTNSFSNLQMWSDSIGMSSSWTLSEAWFMSRNRSWCMSDSRSFFSYCSKNWYVSAFHSTNWRANI